MLCFSSRSIEENIYLCEYQLPPRTALIFNLHGERNQTKPAATTTTTSALAGPQLSAPLPELAPSSTQRRPCHSPIRPPPRHPDRRLFHLELSRLSDCCSVAEKATMTPTNDFNTKGLATLVTVHTAFPFHLCLSKTIHSHLLFCIFRRQRMSLLSLNDSIRRSTHHRSLNPQPSCPCRD
jgi:hypothetical protein